MNAGTREAIARRASPLWRAVFSGWPLEKAAPFRSAEWEVFLLPHELEMTREQFSALASAVVMTTDAWFIVSREHGAMATVLDWEQERLWDVCGTPLWVNDVYLYGESCKWGMICTHGDFSIVGGVPEFMDKYAGMAGGRDKLRTAFMEAIRPPGWFVSSHVTQKLLALAGWLE